MAHANIKKGSCFGLLAFFCMALFAITTKFALQNGSVIWVSFLTYLTGFAILTPYVAYKGLNYLKSEHYNFLIGRALFGLAASFLYTISVNYIPIVNATLLFNTAPIFIPLIALIFMKIYPSKSIWLAVAIGFLGILIIIHPTAAIFTQAGNFIALFSGLALAIAYLIMKILTNTDPGVRIIFYYLSIGTLIQIPLLFSSSHLVYPETFIYSILSGSLLLAAQIALVTAYKYAEAAEVGVYQYASVVFVGLFDWLIWKVIPSAWDIVGILLVAMAGMIIIRTGNRIKK